MRNELYLRFEVPEERIKYKKDGKDVEGPMSIGMTVTNSIGAKSKLRPMLESWRGKPFTEAELSGFEMTAILGKPAQISVSHKPRSAGGVYANITAILGINKLQREAMAAGKLPKAPETDMLVYTPSAHDAAAFEKLPKWIQEKIEKRIVEDVAPVKPGAGHPVETIEDFDDEVPF